MDSPCCGFERLYTTVPPHYCFIHGRWGPHSADLPHISPGVPSRGDKTTKLPSLAKKTTKLRGAFIEPEFMWACLFFAFMAGACATGLYFDLIEKAHPCDPVPCKAVPCVQPPLGKHPPYRFRQFN